MFGTVIRHAKMKKTVTVSRERERVVFAMQGNVEMMMMLNMFLIVCRCWSQGIVTIQSSEYG